MRRVTRAVLVGAIALGIGQLWGCAQERDPINRVQANALPKSFFIGQDLKNTSDDPSFYARGTLTDVGYGASQDGVFTSTYAQPLSIIKWDVTEGYLVGRLSYERIDSTDGKGKRPGLTGKNEGQIAYTYRIESHFDIRRDYNPATGEETNVVIENSTDRPWYDREYMRVDWSQNLVSDAYDLDTLSMLGIIGGVTYSPLAYYISDPGSIDAPKFDQKNGYFDITNKAMAKPENLDISSLGWGIKSYPACMLPSEIAGGTAPIGNCNPVELTIRQSFKRVDTNDYEAQDQDGIRFRAYGAFTEERKGYARDYGLTDNDWHRFTARYDIWDRSHYYTDAAKMTGSVACFTPTTTPYGSDPHRDADGNGTEDECEAVAQATGLGGSRCDQFTQKCTLPYQARKQTPVVWYVNVNSSTDYWEGTSWATHQWDVAMRSAGQVAQYAECKATSGPNCDQYAIYTSQQDGNDDAMRLADEVDNCRHTGKAEAECVALADSIGAQRGMSDGIIKVAKLPEAVVLCHSPVEALDPAVCGDAKTTDSTGKVLTRHRLPAGILAKQCRDLFRNGPKTDAEKDMLATCNDSTVVRLGDLRYHQINNIEAPQDPSAWGIMTDASDPLTGRKVSASINVWTHINDIWSQSLVDQMRYIKQELQTSDVTEGKNVRDWAAAAEALRTGGFQGINKDQLAQRVAATAGLDIKTAAAMPKYTPAEITAAQSAIRDISSIRGDSEALSYNKALYESRRALASNTDFEAQLITPMMQKYAGLGALPYNKDMASLVSPIQGQHPGMRRDLARMQENALASRGACMMNMESPAPFSTAGLADAMQAKFGNFNPNDDKLVQQTRAEAIRLYLAQKVHFSVIVHEMGHSIGLRHNFVSSYDSYNYRPQYWQLRTKNGTVTTECTNLVKDGSTCVGPRYFDPMTKDEADNLIQMFMQSTTMDYAGEYTQDLIGLGAYDFGAARFFYGDAVAVNANTTLVSPKTRAGHIALNKMDGFGGILGMTYNVDARGNESVHYSQLQNEAKLIKDCKTINPDDFKPTDWNEAKYGTWSPLIDGHLVKVDGKYSKCTTQPIDYATWSSLRMPTSSEASSYRGGPAIDPQGRVRVATGFATDSWADLGNLSVYRHDNGADPYELMTFLIAQPEVLHIFNDYRRGKTAFSIKAAANRWRDRYNEKMRDGAKGLGLITNIYRSQVGAILDQLRENTLASGIAFDAFTRQMARPEAGAHFQANDGILRSTNDLGDNAGGTVLLNVPNGATGYLGDIAYGGALIENQLATDKGEFDSVYTVNSGSYYTKAATAMLFTESVDNFISDSRGDFTDARYRSVSMADVFPDGYRRWLANNLTGDDFIKGVRLVGDGSGKPKIEAGTKFPTAGMGNTSWWKPTPEVCFPNAGTTICSDLTTNNTGLAGNAPADLVVVDPQVAWEQQKFLIAWTLMYLPENQKSYWLDQMTTYELGRESDPGFDSRIEFHHPNGKTFVAKTFGKETIFGKTVQKGIAARILEHANGLLKDAYLTDAVTKNGTTWYTAQVDANGVPKLKNGEASCQDSAACRTLDDYVSVVNYLRQGIQTFQYDAPRQKGVY